MLAHEPVKIGQAALRYDVNRPGQLEDRRIGQPVVHMEAFLSRFDHRRVFQCLKMLGCIGERQAHFCGEGFNSAFALRQ
jgi:hypothetical protein